MAAPLRLWHLTSLDAPTVAVSWSLGFAWAAHVWLPLWLPVVLALSAWSFYIADRLFDARRGFSTAADADGRGASALRPRHLFHWDRRRIFLPLAVAAAVVACGLVLHSMPLAARERNSVLAVAAVAYFTSVHSPRRLTLTRWRFRLPKELLVALIFTLACAAPTWARAPRERALLLGPVLVFIALAWLNCQAIETWEATATQGTSGRIPILRLAMGLGALAVLSGCAAALFHLRVAALLASAGVSAGLLGALDRWRDRILPTTLRAAADLVLLTPLLLLVLQ
jgi:hypothetical protein